MIFMVGGQDRLDIMAPIAYWRGVLMLALQTPDFAVGLPWEFPWVVLGVVICAGLLYYFVPDERRHVRTALTLFAIGAVGLLATSYLGGVASNAVSASLVTTCAANVSLALGGIAIINLLGVFVFAVLLRPARLEPPPIAQDLLLALGYIGVAIFVLSHAGVDLRGIVATSAVITAVIGFSLQDSLGNVMGGLALQMERSIRAGDWIRVDDIEGRVKQIRWRQTSIETRNWDTVVIPNSVLMKVKVTVLGRRAGSPVQRRQWVYFRVDLSHSPTRVIHAVESAIHADNIPNVATQPKAQCLLNDFKDGDAVYALRYWLTDLAQTDPTDSLVRTKIYAALRRAGIGLAVPTQAVLLTQETDAGRERKENEEATRRLDALRRQEFFQALTDEERAELAPRLVPAHFVRGEAITRQGAEAHWLYLIAEGDASVEVTVDSKTQRVATLGQGDIFGEMGLMTGEVRTATVNALTDVACYRLGKEAFEDILRSRPGIAEQISLILARRRVELDAVREQLDTQVRGERTRDVQGVLLRRIREFFAIR